MLVLFYLEDLIVIEVVVVLDVLVGIVKICFMYVRGKLKVIFEGGENVEI